MCCKLLGIGELEKPRDIWCTHCDIGKGCKIYSERPESCKVFRCLWIDGVGVPELWPARSKAVFMISPLDEKQLQVNIDIGKNWRGTRIDRAINSYLNMGYNVAIVQGRNRQMIFGKGREVSDVVLDEETGEKAIGITLSRAL